jgi:hypothetical protein
MRPPSQLPHPRPTLWHPDLSLGSRPRNDGAPRPPCDLTIVYITSRVSTGERATPRCASKLVESVRTAGMSEEAPRTARVLRGTPAPPPMFVRRDMSCPLL